MSVKGTKRQQIIAKWLRGEDDPEYDVIPTKDENKYIIRKKIPLQTPELESKETKDDKEPEVIDEVIEEKPKSFTPDISQQILQELRLMREEKERKREEKMRKKEIKMIAKKTVRKNIVQPVYEDETEEVEISIPQRRRVNLLSRMNY